MSRFLASRLSIEDVLDAAEAAAPVEAVDVLGRYLAEAMGARAVSFLIADFSGRNLVRLGHARSPLAGRASDGETAEEIPLDGTPHGHAIASQTVQVISEDDGTRVIAPVTTRGEAVGVLELSLPATPDEQLVSDVALAAHILAYIVIANRRFTDLFEWGQRSVPLTLAAEVQHRLLPGAYTCEAGQFTLAAWLEPAGNVGGDTFDFSLERGVLHLSMTDAMGHRLDAAILATVLVAALRNARRGGMSLAEQADLAGAALAEQVRGTSAFVTGQLARIDLASSSALIVNAGHPRPVRIRHGGVEQVELEVDQPFGLQTAGFREQALALEPGDRLVFLTDGMLDRNAANIDLLGLLRGDRDLHAREAVQHLTHAVLGACNGQLRDDATAMMLDWHGGPPRKRRQSSGANR